MASPIHPCQPSSSDSTTQPSGQPPQYAAPGGFVFYGNANTMAATAPAPGSANGVNGPPNAAGLSPGVPSTQGYAYAAPTNYGYPVAGVPGGAQAYFVGPPGAQGGYLAGFPGAQVVMYGVPNAAGFIRPDTAPNGYQASLQDAQVDSPTNGAGTQAYAPGHPAINQGSLPSGYQASPQDTQASAPVNTYGAPMYTPGYPFPVYTVGASAGLPPIGDGAQGYPMQGAAPGFAPGAPGVVPTSAPGLTLGGAPSASSGAATGGTNSAAANTVPGANMVGNAGIGGVPYGAAPGNTFGGAIGFGYGGSAVVYPAPYVGPPENVGMNVNGDYKGLQAAQGHAHPQQQHAPVNPRDQIETGRWSTGLCSCCDSCVPNCCMATCLPCVSLAQIYARLGLMSYLPALLVFFFFVLASYSINFGSLATTTTYTTYPYQDYYYEYSETTIDPAVAQMATHVKSYTPGSCGFESRDVLQGYTP